MENVEIDLPSLQEVPEWAEVLLFLGLFVAIGVMISLGYGFRTVQAEYTCAQEVSICRGVPTDTGCIGINSTETFYDSPRQCSEHDTITAACSSESDTVPVEALDVFNRSCSEWSQAYDIELPE